jgi:hypothetical protein
MQERVQLMFVTYAMKIKPPKMPFKNRKWVQSFKFYCVPYISGDRGGTIAAGSIQDGAIGIFH